MAIISNFLCQEDAIEFINNFDTIIGLGDVECPQYLNNYHGILGEMESVYIQKYLKKNNRIITNYLDFSTDFSTNIYITHFPPKGFDSGITYRVKIGRSDITSLILENKAKIKIVLHGHSEEQKIVDKLGIKIISIGSFYKGYYAEYNEHTKEIKLLKWSSH
ncbi:hypothetical protein B6F84_07925 [Acidianus manzaensis]|uniref:Calcineurin-like phosphoesterase domain-containing protein n=1 Tax=Acidianus manzaensis TaxID=282676 RepID=A0A1W6K3P2_9CREN|nr:hypothetical protein B6F84_07925 [Acidianus manzaensis]